jgi:hypothetical protein
MGKPQRIPVGAIQAMKKILDALPDKNLDKTKEEALAMLNSQIQRAYSKGYSVKELAAILSEGKVAVSAPTLRAHTWPSSTRMRKAKPKAAAPEKAAPPQTEPMKPETQNAIPVRKADTVKMPSYYTPDLPDSEL